MANKLLLLNDVQGLGRKGDIVSNARPGYIRNFLLPKKLAVIATPGTLRMQARLQEERQKQAVVDKKESEEFAEKIKTLELTKVVKVDQEGHMYGSVPALEVAHLIQEASGIALEKTSIQLQHPIKTTGVHEIKIKLKEGVTTSVSLNVIPEETHQKPETSKKTKEA